MDRALRIGASALCFVALLVLIVLGRDFPRADTLSIPFTFSPSTTISSAQMNSNFQTIASIVNGKIDQANIEAGSVGTTQLTDGGIQTVDILDAQVTSNKISDGAVASIDIATGGVASVDILDATIANGDIANDTILTGKLAPSAVAKSATSSSVAASGMTTSASFVDIPNITSASITPGSTNDMLIMSFTGNFTGTAATGEFYEFAFSVNGADSAVVAKQSVNSVGGIMFISAQYAVVATTTSAITIKPRYRRLAGSAAPNWDTGVERRFTVTCVPIK